jgi:ATP-dependent exoDNAse (exonuclease V) alpha subunit
MCITKNLPIEKFDNNILRFIHYDDFDDECKFEKCLNDLIEKEGLKIGTDTSILTPQKAEDKYNKNYIGGVRCINEMIQKKLNKNKNYGEDEWSKEEDRMLGKAFEKYGKNEWVEISRKVFDNKWSPEQCSMRFKTLNNDTSKHDMIYIKHNKFYKSDKVIRIKNSYKNNKLKANGDCGIIYDIYTDTRLNKQYLFVKYDDDDDDDEPEKISSDDFLNEFKLCYGMTIHKKQGDEDDYIIIVVSNKHTMLGTGPYGENAFSLMYTAISRAKKRCFIIGDEKTYKEIFEKKRVSTFYTTFLEEERMC